MSAAAERLRNLAQRVARAHRDEVLSAAMDVDRLKAELAAAKERDQTARREALEAAAEIADRNVHLQTRDRIRALLDKEPHRDPG